MDIQTAKTRCYEAVNRLQDSGIKTVVKPSRSRTIQKTVDKYHGAEGRLPADRWNHVAFFPESQDEVDRIWAELSDLAGRGIVFDTGGCQGQRDWELDWSLHISADTAQTLEGRQVVEDIIGDHYP